LRNMISVQYAEIAQPALRRTGGRPIGPAGRSPYPALWVSPQHL